LARRHGWSEEQIDDLANFRNRSDFTDAEKAAIELAERTTLDSNRVAWVVQQCGANSGEAQWTAAKLFLYC
jgi:alkylhydroperoxidase family enzyme